MQFDTVQMMLPFVQEIIDKNTNSRRLAEYIDFAEFSKNIDNIDNKNKFLNVSKSIPAYYKHIRKNFRYGYISEKAERVANCGKTMNFDLYEKQKTKVLKKIFLCKNRWCLNCIKQRVLTRLFRFGPHLDKTFEDYDLYHMVLTVKNCSAEELNKTIKDIHSAFTKLSTFLLVGKNRKPRKEFKKYGCVAMLRSLEITYNKRNRFKGEEYHPHLHCIIALRKGLELVKNKTHEIFGYDYTNGKKYTRYFSELELKLQKIWYLLVNNKKYNKQNMLALQESYSVILDPIEESSYYEVFKYACKVYDEKSKPIEFEQFSVLDESLKNKRTMCGYGLWYGIQSDDGIEEGFHEAQKIIEAFLQRTEEPQYVHNTINEVVKDMSEELEYVYLNLKLIYTIGNEDLNKISEISSNSEMHQIIYKIERKKGASIIEKRVSNFKQLYLKRFLKFPTQLEIEQYKRSLRMNECGKFTSNLFKPLLTNDNQITFSQFNEFNQNSILPYYKENY